MSPEDAWCELLGRLESEVRRARAGEPLEPWQPPADMPPLPAALVTRALALRAAQAELAASAAARREQILRALARGRRASASATAERAPVYLDAVG
ncbi:hypothetical protein GCM10022288_08120 [Gryllotalpicola kribbensis]|uniref:Uncharacterized protein n=1 Tax=Gryllotalpicola kribbensis TaxID=993084 RepID=A0ABP8AL09_9MICO